MSNIQFLEACELLKLESASDSMIEFGRQGLYGPLRAGMRADGTFELLIPLGHESDYPEIVDPGRLIPESRPLRTSGGVIRFLSIRPGDVDLVEPFARVADSISDRIVGGSTIASAVESAVRQFRALVERERAPSHERMVGLFGELHFLSQELSVNQKAMEAWTGPSGSRHDFTIEGRALEVKTSATPFPVKVRINGLHQLSPVGDDILYLIVYGLETVGVGGHTLNELVEKVSVNKYFRDVLVGKLGEVGLSADAIPDTPRYVVKSVRSFKVQEGFPRVEAGSSVNPDGVPAIEDVTYSLHLAGLQSYAVREESLRGFTCPEWEVV